MACLYPLLVYVSQFVKHGNGLQLLLSTQSSEDKECEAVSSPTLDLPVASAWTSRSPHMPQSRSDNILEIHDSSRVQLHISSLTLIT